MSNGDDQQMNCVLEICCEAHSEKQYEALALKIAHDLPNGGDPDTMAKWILKHFDLAEVGTLSAFKASIARVAKAQRKDHV